MCVVSADLSSLSMRINKSISTHSSTRSPVCNARHYNFFANQRYMLNQVETKIRLISRYVHNQCFCCFETIFSITFRSKSVHSYINENENAVIRYPNSVFHVNTNQGVYHKRPREKNTGQMSIFCYMVLFIINRP